jgi:Protein of unknown function (DUF1360)
LPHWMTVLLICLATHRLTRFVTRDAFPLVAVPREWIDRHWGMEESDIRELKAAKLANPSFQLHYPNIFKRSFAYLITCDWCTSIWTAAAITTFVMIFIGFTWPWWILSWLTASTVTGLIAQREPE